MILLVRSVLDQGLYKTGMIDAPGNGSATSMYHNIIECCSLLNPFEDVLKQITPTFNAYGYTIYDEQDFEAKVKPLYQLLRHGLAFDWVLNHIVTKLYATFPFCSLKLFSGTADFINVHSEDHVFQAELQTLDSEYDKLLAALFGDLDRTVFARLVTEAGTNDFIQCVRWARDNNRINDFYITEALIYNMNYLVALGMMLEKCIGVIKRAAWHDAFDKIASGELDGVIVCGGKFRAFAFGKLWDDSKAGWHMFDLGIKLSADSSRTQRADYIRVFPDEMTFYRFTPHTITIDESYFPTISLDNGTTWLNTAEFEETADLPMDKPIKVLIKYKFTQDPNVKRIIKIKARANCAVKDDQLELNSDGIAETQMILRGDSIGFKISETTKNYPFAVFSNSKLKIKDFDWL
jgi:hypothetical protein